MLTFAFRSEHPSGHGPAAINFQIRLQPCVEKKTPAIQTDTLVNPLGSEAETCRPLRGALPADFCSSFNNLIQSISDQTVSIATLSLGTGVLFLI